MNKKLITILMMFLINTIIISCDATSNNFDEYKLNGIISSNINIINEENIISKHNLYNLTIIHYDEVYNQLKLIKEQLNKNNSYNFTTITNNNVSYHDLIITQNIINKNKTISHNVLMKFIEYNDNNALYYKSTNINYTNNDNKYKWILNGFTLINGSNFTIDTLVYIKTINDDTKEIIYIAIPITIKGKLNIKEETLIYEFII